MPDSALYLGKDIRWYMNDQAYKFILGIHIAIFNGGKPYLTASLLCYLYCIITTDRGYGFACFERFSCINNEGIFQSRNIL